MQAIERSVLRTEVVLLAWTQDAEDELMLYCDQDYDIGAVYEFWGRDEYGDEWRVSLLRDQGPA